MKNNKKNRKSVLRKTFPFLNAVSRLPLNLNKRVLKVTKGDPAIYKSFREMAFNVQNGNVNINKKKLRPSDIKFLKDITKKENKTSKCSCAKRSKFIQRGAGLLGLLMSAISAIAPAFMPK